VVLVDSQAVATITDDDPLPRLSINDPTITEGNAGTKNLTFTVSLSEVSGRSVSVQYTTADATATAGSDYLAKSGTLTIFAGWTSQTVTITINGDIDRTGRTAAAQPVECLECRDHRLKAKGCCSTTTPRRPSAFRPAEVNPVGGDAGLKGPYSGYQVLPPARLPSSAAAAKKVQPESRLPPAPVDLLMLGLADWTSSERENKPTPACSLTTPNPPDDSAEWKEFWEALFTELRP
jgi:hypothetical protein